MGAANILRGPIDQADFKSYIFPLLFFKRFSDVYDEEFALALEESDGDIDYASFAENHRFQVPEGAHWNDVRERPENLGLALQTRCGRSSSRSRDAPQLRLRAPYRAPRRVRNARTTQAATKKTTAKAAR